MCPDAPRVVDVRLRAAVESSPSGLLMIDQGGRIVLVNREIERLFGRSREELLGQPVELLVPERYRGAHPGSRATYFAAPRVRSMGAGRELFGLRKDGSEFPVEIGLTPVATGEGLFVISSIVDISARKAAEQEHQRLEEQLRQAQKLEAVGRLAGGIAHDFNNILAVIVGYTELVRDSAARRENDGDLERVLEAAARGKELVERILVFSRRQEVVRRPMDLRQTLIEASRLLRPTLPSTVEILLDLDRTPNRILADPTSVHQVVMNLVTNATHAMPAGGAIQIGVEPFYAKDSFARAHPGLREGPFALLRIRDRGTGMSAETLARAFEPFFTTKAQGQGTGLGLAMVHGIVRDHGGATWIESQQDQGTTVCCLFPALETEEAEEVGLEPVLPRGRGERILFVDDEPALAELGRRRLIALGYEVTALSDPLLAMATLRATPEAFDLVITDFLMPRMTGVDLAREIGRMRPGLGVVMLTGHIEDFPGDLLSEVGVRALVKKPLTLPELAGVLRQALCPDS
ncbi:MAG: PAS domain S-box protein [Thermoanaerobaculia bacterium]|nr:PAS domain S-box protein [Thermoanaerobaculia bacterium]